MLKDGLSSLYLQQRYITGMVKELISFLCNVDPIFKLTGGLRMLKNGL